MAAMADEVLAARASHGVQIETIDAAAGAHAGLGAQFIERNQDRRPMIMLGQSAGHDADHARMPTAAGQHEGGACQRVADFVGQFIGRSVDAALERLPLIVEPVDEFRQLDGLAPRSLGR